MGRVTTRRFVTRIDLLTPADPELAGQGLAGQGLAGQGLADNEHAGQGLADQRSDPGGAVPGRSRTAAVTVVTRMDTLVGEEPLEIRVGHRGGPKRPIAVTMRTPGDDLDLAIGFLFTEGLIGSAEDVLTAQLCAGTDEPNTYNVVDVTLAPHVPEPETDPARNFYTTSSCGVCGKASIDAVRTRSRFDVRTDVSTVDVGALAGLPARLRRSQPTFDRTGGLHAAGLFTVDGELVCAREDVGRHNAVDKVVGWALREGRIPLPGHVLLVSGRAGFELVQKAWMAGIPMLAAVSAPSSLAVDLAEEAGLTLVGFLRGASMNVYAGADRVAG
jgi:FdhD protein